MRERKEHRSVYVELKDLVKGAAAHLTVTVRTEPLTCRVVTNMGLECVIAGVELLKMHGITKAQVLGFVDLLFGRPGDIDGMHKGGKNEHVLRAAMRIVNGEIIRHGSLGPEVEGASHEAPHQQDVLEVTPMGGRHLNPNLN